MNFHDTYFVYTPVGACNKQKIIANMSFEVQPGCVYAMPILIINRVLSTTLLDFLLTENIPTYPLLLLVI